MPVIYCSLAGFFQNIKKISTELIFKLRWLFQMILLNTCKIVTSLNVDIILFLYDLTKSKLIFFRHFELKHCAEQPQTCGTGLMTNDYAHALRVRPTLNCFSDLNLLCLL